MASFVGAAEIHCAVELVEVIPTYDPIENRSVCGCPAWPGLDVDDFAESELGECGQSDHRQSSAIYRDSLNVTGQVFA